MLHKKAWILCSKRKVNTKKRERENTKKREREHKKERERERGVYTKVV